MIHEQAIVHKGAEIGANVSIGPFTVIGNNVKIGDNTVIGSMVTIDEFTTIGADCRIFHHAAIGATPQSVKFAGEESHVVIGDRCLVREFVTIHRGTGFGGGLTKLGDDNFLMAYTHIAHDCITGKGVLFSNAATLAGHVEIGDYASIGGLVAIHQFTRVGDYAFVGGKSAVPKDIPPYVLAAGDRARLHGLNKVGLKRHGFTPEVLDALKKAYRIIFRIGLTMNEAIERVKAEVPDLPEVQTFLQFLESSKRGVTRGKPGRD
ncbi:acyl-[acyl-carrier-protein]--UDP-N-acetylglucosamine O-acyltransferase [Desulfatibacillum alkenivorans DSM 16219]|jgi:UDP-N-acetylglucosamine acyltransferase|uniref:Acyl-[acyl-carrier-protein]--UDP-N-acetylglucosamine O-acyltransferase n=1 Tax=Desulfatibacillum alkenivorans DSM 16219 TaxID=1121393 RepID=A0A1M6CLH7_9BACT|nr:acyl-ACP--UDP-N-acetylglucosamine O-acyltransferase [Desulfatibacillum alkenivorans]SHI61783.1 acyl-[acyl-carrier-protein]--UDP-N-acetylglucosamine O-acyltransferase [Desulfatibacillum alkenivorans DSM 16219]